MITLHRTAAMMVFLFCLVVVPTWVDDAARAEDPQRETDPRRETPSKGEPKKERSDGQRGQGEPRGGKQDETRDDRGEDRGNGLRGEGEAPGRVPDSPSPPETLTPRSPQTLSPPSATPYIPVTPTYTEREVEIHCDDTWVCVVDETDEYIAWMLSRQTSIPWKHFVIGRDEGLSWQALMDRLEIESWEFFAALDEETPFDAKSTVLEDTRLRALAKAHLAGVDLRRFPCRFPVVLRGVGAQELPVRRHRGSPWPGDQRERRPVPLGLDSVDDDIAERIVDETGWCFHSLIEAREFLGSWSRVAREFYLSPFLFEASFGIELEVRWLESRRRVEYPTEDRIREVAMNEAWPELRRR